MFSQKYADLFSIILNTDSYKISMWNQYPLGTRYVYSYIEARGGEYDKTIMFGLQYFIKAVLSKPITMEQIDFAEKIITKHGYAFNRAGWEYIVKNYNGKLPLLVKAVPEGTVMDKKNVLATIVNTDPECYWLTTYIETAMLRSVWYGTTVASNSYASKQIIKAGLEETGDVSGLGFKLHDFGSRGVSSLESAAIGGMAHLINFKGTDNVAALVAAMDYYDAEDVIGFSIPAMEHSTVTSWGRENEVDAYRNMLNQYAKPGAILAAVSDSYDIYKACELWGTELKDQIINSGATVVIRPDSGDASSVIVKCLQILEKYFGSTVNDKGYRVLPPCIRMIQGDGITHRNIESILFSMKMAGFSADNIAFGQGGALLQGIDRDTLKFAMKCSSICIGDEWKTVQKDPITDSGKRSKKGRMKLIAFKDVTFNDYEVSTTGDEFYTTITDDDVSKEVFDYVEDEMQTVYLDGEVLNTQTFEQIRARANA